MVPEVSHLGWGHWYTLRELEDCTQGFADENVIGEGGYGIVYYGVFEDNTQVAVKNLLNNRSDQFTHYSTSSIIWANCFFFFNLFVWLIFEINNLSEELHLNIL